jgi:putative toxin-antitoxin system antitoxin component (TIGR02293 family)
MRTDDVQDDGITKMVETTTDRRPDRDMRSCSLPDASLLGLNVETSGELRAMIEQELEFASWQRLQEYAGLTLKQMSEAVQVNEKTLGRRRASGRLTPLESDRLVRLSRIVARAADLFEGDQAAARRWLTAPRPVLGGVTPLEAARTEVGAREVEQLIERLEDGVFS